jgi:hypothetical protein
MSAEYKYIAAYRAFYNTLTRIHTFRLDYNPYKFSTSENLIGLLSVWLAQLVKPYACSLMRSEGPGSIPGADNLDS